MTTPRERAGLFPVGDTVDCGCSTVLRSVCWWVGQLPEYVRDQSWSRLNLDRASTSPSGQLVDMDVDAFLACKGMQIIYIYI